MRLADITLIVPTKDEASNIVPFLASLPRDVRLIIVDSSRDETRALIDAHRPHHTLIIQQHGTVTQARQPGAEVAETPWLLYSDADVVFPAEFFGTLLAQSEVDVVYGPKLSRDRFIRYYTWVARGQALSHWLGIPAASGSNMAVRRDALVAAGGFDLDLTCNEDTELVWRIKRAGFRVRYWWQQIVWAQDHRRLESGVVAKTLHSVSRCSLLYAGLLPRTWRSHDWGYWSRRD